MWVKISKPRHFLTPFNPSFATRRNMASYMYAMGIIECRSIRFWHDNSCFAATYHHLLSTSHSAISLQLFAWKQLEKKMRKY